MVRFCCFLVLMTVWEVSGAGASSMVRATVAGAGLSGNAGCPSPSAAAAAVEEAQMLRCLSGVAGDACGAHDK